MVPSLNYFDCEAKKTVVSQIVSSRQTHKTAITTLLSKSLHV